MTDLDGLGVAALAQQFASKALSPVEAVTACLDRIERHNDDLNAFTSVYPELALAAAHDAEAAIVAGDTLGPLHGVPVAVKDLFAVEGMDRTCGSRMFSESTGRKDAECVARLKDAGAIIVGLLNLHEFAFGPTGINPHFGTARNPWDRSRVCGGSSSGSACAVASGLVPGSLGTDTGGSIRIPAALCGLVGLKPTHDLVSRKGIFPLCEDFDTGGPLARSVADVALIMRVIADDDATSVDEADGEIDGLTDVRVGMLGSPFFDDLHPDIATAVNDAIAEIGDLGADVHEADLTSASVATPAWDAIALAAAYDLHKDRANAPNCTLSPDSHARILRGQSYGVADVEEALRTQDLVKRNMGTLMGRFDVLALPTTPIPAVSIDSAAIEFEGRTVDGGAALGRLTRLASLTGQPAISVPCGFTREGLPIGLQLIGRWREEADLFRIARAYERSARWQDRRPQEPV